jgi:hypothetical protein
VPLHPPYQCPVGGCAYIARDSRQSLIRHYGMTHKVIVELLKQHVPNYEAIDPFPSDDHHQQVVHHQTVEQQHHQVYYQHAAQQQEIHQFTEQDLQDPMLAAYYQQEYQQQQQQQLHLPVQQQPHIVFGQQQMVGNEHMRFEPQIDGTFDPSHYSDHSMDGIRSVPTTPIKAGLVQPAMPPPAPTADTLLLSLAAEHETELVSAPSVANETEKSEDEPQQQVKEEEEEPAQPKLPGPNVHPPDDNVLLPGSNVLPPGVGVLPAGASVVPAGANVLPAGVML